MRYLIVHMNIRKNIDSNQKIIVGVNKFEDEDEDINSLQNIDPVEVEKQIKGLNTLKKLEITFK